MPSVSSGNHQVVKTPSSHVLSHSLRSFQFQHHPLHRGKKKGKKSNGNDSKQLDVIISETQGWQCGKAGNAMRRHGQSLLLRVEKASKERDDWGTGHHCPAGRQPLHQNYSGTASRRPPLSSLLSLSFKKKKKTDLRRFPGLATVTHHEHRFFLLGSLRHTYSLLNQKQQTDDDGGGGGGDVH